ncbi:MAG: Ig-like domain-containing protein [Eubacteriales bacterium]|nr:Ig-like domain-containing protein [Eubacteriales bacterium]
MCRTPASRLLSAACLLLCVMLLAPAALADDGRDAQFDTALAGLLTPALEGDETGVYTLHTGDSAYVPCVAPPITPYDERESAVYPAVNGVFASSDEAVVTVDANGLMTGVAPGEATVTYSAPNGDRAYLVSVGNDYPPELVKNYIYVLQREFYSVKRARLPKYNKYAKWYYGKKKEVGWCSVFTIYCANASGNNPIKLGEIDPANVPMVQYLREGQVGHQYDGFMAMNRFVGVPKPGYLVIYADMSNAYRTVHIGSIVDVQALGDGLYALTTIEGNMSNSVKSYCYVYDSKRDNHLVGTQKGLKLQNNMSELPAQSQTDPLVQYQLHTDHWSVFGFCQTWE